MRPIYSLWGSGSYTIDPGKDGLQTARRPPRQEGCHRQAGRIAKTSDRLKIRVPGMSSSMRRVSIFS